MKARFSSSRHYRSQIISHYPKKRGYRLHWVLLLTSLIAVPLSFSLLSKDASATRSDWRFWSDLPVLNSTDDKLILPLTLPPPTVHLPGKSFQDAALSEQDWQTVIVARGDNLSSMLQRVGLGPEQVHDIMELGKPVEPLAHLKPGQEIKLIIDEDQSLKELVYAVDENALHIHRVEDQLKATDITHPLDTRISYAAGVITSSLFDTTQQAGVSDPMTLEMADIFRWDIDFAQDLQLGDSFGLIYEEQFMDGEKVRDGNIIAAEFTNEGTTYRAVRHVDSNGELNYFTPEGRSLRKAFLRTPVDFARISSGFSLARYHPILHRFRAHKGVDYAAPSGTPVKAVSDGKVVFAGQKNGYGNFITLQHFGAYSSAYAHLKGFARGLKQGSSVKQGDVIGYVGQTGLASGPHLHYEFRIDGIHHNPLTVALPKAEPLVGVAKIAFHKDADKWAQQLDVMKNTSLAWQDAGKQ